MVDRVWCLVLCRTVHLLSGVMHKVISAVKTSATRILICTTSIYYIYIYVYTIIRKRLYIVYIYNLYIIYIIYNLYIIFILIIYNIFLWC